jgi:hypothetical protein
MLGFSENLLVMLIGILWFKKPRRDCRKVRNANASHGEI